MTRVARFDPHAAVAAVAGHTGVRLAVDGPCPGGEVGAAYVRWPDGRRGVIGEGRADRAPVLAAARRAGLPAPRYDLVVTTATATVVVQECLPGRPPAEVDRALVDAMVDLNRRCAGALEGVDGVPRPDLFLTADGPGFCLHGPLRTAGGRAARLLDWVHDVGRWWRPADAHDLVHMDYHPGNVLVDGGRISGVVDWDGAGRGDRILDLVTLRYDLAARAPTLGRRLDGMLEPSDALRAAWAHMGLRLVDWSLRHHGPAEVDVWLDVAEAGMRRFG